jgi:hypothetical protein
MKDHPVKADDMVVGASEAECRETKRKYYNPPTEIRDVAGVKRKVQTTRSDIYTGTKADLIAAGLLRDGLFPGDPGRASALSAVYWPVGTAKPNRHWQPGLMYLRKTPHGTFAISLTVDAAEQARREAAEEARHAESNRRREAENHKFEAQRRVADSRRRLERLLGQLGEEVGIDELAEVFEAERRKARPPRCASHLRVVWSRPSL